MRGESLQSGLGASSATTIMQSRLTPPAALTGKGSSMRANAAARVAQSFSAKAYENGPGTCLSGCLPVLMRSNGGGGPSEDRRMQEMPRRPSGDKVLQQSAKYEGHHALVGVTGAGTPDSLTAKHGGPAVKALSEAVASQTAAARSRLAGGQHMCCFHTCCP